MINPGSLLDGGGERKLTKKRSKALEVKGKNFTKKIESSRDGVYKIHSLQWSVRPSIGQLACVASVSVEQRAKKERRTGVSAFCPRKKWGESHISRPIFRAGKTLKTRFFALCSTETLATQAIG